MTTRKNDKPTRLRRVKLERDRDFEILKSRLEKYSTDFLRLQREGKDKDAIKKAADGLFVLRKYLQTKSATDFETTFISSLVQDLYAISQGDIPELLPSGTRGHRLSSFEKKKAVPSYRHAISHHRRWLFCARGSEKSRSSGPTA